MIRSLVFFLSVTLVLGACSRPSYINVPNDGSDAAINGPNWQTTRQIQKAALHYLLSEDPVPGDVVIRLPEGTRETTAIEIADSLSQFNVFPESLTPSEEFRLIEVRKIVARGGRGRVDVIRPGKLRERELVEVHMGWSLWDGWQPEYLRPRNIDVDRIDPLLLAAPAPDPAAPAVQPEEAPEEAAEETDAVEDASE